MTLIMEATKIGKSQDSDFEYDTEGYTAVTLTELEQLSQEN